MTDADVIAVNYGQGFGWSGSFLAELCSPPETSTVFVSHNFDRGSEVGLYQVALGEDEFRDALAILRRSRYDQLPEQAQPVPPETCFLHIGVRRRGESMPTTRDFPVDALPAEVVQLRAELEANVIPRVRENPIRVLSISAAWQKPTFNPREGLAVEVSLLSKGVLPIVIQNPLGPERAGSGLSLALRNPAGRQTSVSLSVTHLRAQSGAPEGDEVTLAAGQRLAFSIQKKTYLVPGVYDGLLVYRSQANDADPQAIRGELWLPLGPVTVAELSPP